MGEEQEAYQDHCVVLTWRVSCLAWARMAAVLTWKLLALAYDLVRSHLCHQILLGQAKAQVLRDERVFDQPCLKGAEPHTCQTMYIQNHCLLGGA